MKNKNQSRGYCLAALVALVAILCLLFNTSPDTSGKTTFATSGLLDTSPDIVPAFVDSTFTVDLPSPAARFVLASKLTAFPAKPATIIGVYDVRSPAVSFKRLPFTGLSSSDIQSPAFRSTAALRT